MKKNQCFLSESVASLIIIVALSGCSWSDPVKVENDFGNSVRQMIDQQLQKPVASQSQYPLDAGKGLDGDTALNSLETYRASQKRPRENVVSEPFKIGK